MSFRDEADGIISPDLVPSADLHLHSENSAGTRGAKPTFTQQLGGKLIC